MRRQKNSVEFMTESIWQTLSIVADYIHQEFMALICLDTVSLFMFMQFWYLWPSFDPKEEPLHNLVWDKYAVMLYSVRSPSRFVLWASATWKILRPLMPGITWKGSQVPFSNDFYTTDLLWYSFRLWIEFSLAMYTDHVCYNKSHT